MNVYHFIWEDGLEKLRMNSHMAPGVTVLQFEVHQAKSSAEEQTACMPRAMMHKEQALLRTALQSTSLQREQFLNYSFSRSEMVY